MGPEQAGDALAAWIRVYAAMHPGFLSQAARTRRSVASGLLRETLGHPMAKMALALHGVAIRSLAAHHVAAVADRVVESLQGEPGEAGQVARTYPDWIRSEVRILAHDVIRVLNGA